MNQNESNKPPVLVVDDEEIVLSFVSDALEDEACAIYTASSGSAALELAAEHEFALVLSDIRMPGMDGIELVRQLRESSPHLAVIFMTGYANLNSAKDAIKQGASDYIMKPFELAEIRQAVRAALKRRMELEEGESDRSLQSLTDLHSMLFSAGDKRSLIVSSLKFAMMHQQASNGSVLFFDEERQRFVVVTIQGDYTKEKELSPEPLASALANVTPDSLQTPMVIHRLEEHPLIRQTANSNLPAYLCPDWFSEEQPMVLVPIARSNTIHGLIMLGFDEDTLNLSSHRIQFLQISSCQLAIALENLALLRESQQAFARLKQLQDETIELEKMATRGEMSAEIGHELNNFLAVIAGNISMIDIYFKKNQPEKIDKHIKSVQATIEKITKFTANLMDLQPISSKKEVLSFSKILKDVVEYLLPQKRYTNVTIEIADIPDDLAFEADSTQIQQLLYNLLNNAADATLEKGNGLIRVSTAAVENTFTVAIEDNGVGFDAEKREIAFRERFTTKQTGHGFGLLVCRRIIEQHGGSLEIESSKGVGTTIRITFPRCGVAESTPV